MILNRQRRVKVAVGPLERFLREAKRATGTGRAEVTVCFVSNAEIARLNRTYRNKTGPTDVLSFPPHPTTPARKKRTRSDSKNAHAHETAFIGDIAIAPETARKYAKRHGRSLPVELRILILHGILHLLGYDHEADRGEMEKLERGLRRRLRLE